MQIKAKQKTGKRLYFLAMDTENGMPPGDQSFMEETHLTKQEYAAVKQYITDIRDKRMMKFRRVVAKLRLAYLETFHPAA